MDGSDFHAQIFLNIIKRLAHAPDKERKMKCLKMLGLAVAVAATLTVFVAPASATILTSPPGTIYTGGLKLVSEGEILIDNEFGLGPMRCSWTLEGKVESHGAGITTTGKFTNLAITGCTDGTVLNKVFAAGSFEVHPDTPPNGNGTVTVSGLEFTITHPGAFNCKFSAGAGLDFGTLIGSATTGSNATLDVNGVKLPRTADSPFCGTAATLTGSFKVETPSALYVDAS